MREHMDLCSAQLLMQLWREATIQNRLRWYGHVLREKDDDWVKKCMEYEVWVPDQEKTKEDLEKCCGKGLFSM